MNGHTHFTDKETKAWRGQVVCLRPLGKNVTEPRLEIALAVLLTVT